jgi:hypothetical protein
MCCPSVSGSFIAFSVITYLALFVLTMLNMIFSILTPKNKETFKMTTFTNYKQEFSLSFLVNMEFGKDLSNRDNYGITSGATTNVCYTGKCSNDNKYFWSTPDCTQACFESLTSCYNSDNTKCKYMSCIHYRENSDPNYKCITHNKIYKWKDYEIKKEMANFKYIPYYHIINSGQSCEPGYDKCGKINDRDYLCLEKNDDYGCPINKIVVNKEENQPSDNFNYKTQKIGDKYIHFTNDNVNGYIYTSLYVDSDYKRNSSSSLELLDSDEFKQFLSYNPYIYNGDFNRYSNWPETINEDWSAYLYKVRFISDKTSEEIKSLQKEYEENIKIYKSEKIEEMNNNVKSYTGVLMGFGIASFSLLPFIAMIFIPLYSSFDCGKQCSCDCCKNMTPMKHVLLFYLICSPTVIFSIIGFFVTLSKKSLYNEYSSMKYIDRYKNYEMDFFDEEKYVYFEKSITYNNAQFIILLIILVFIILYPILICLTSRKKEESPSVEDIKKVASTNKNKKKNNVTELKNQPIYNSGDNNGYNSSYSQNYAQPQQPIYNPQPQPIYAQSPPQPLYPGEQSYYPQQQQQHYAPGALYGPQ